MILIPGLLRFLKRTFWEDDIPAIIEEKQFDPNTVSGIVYLLDRKESGRKAASEEQIERVRILCGGRIPLAYFEFLKYMGRGCNHFMAGSSVFTNELFELKEATLELCEENSIPPIPENAFVFWMHQGYQALYFIPEEGEDNPYVYYFTEAKNMNGFIRQDHRFIDFLKLEMIGHYPDTKDKLYPDGNIPKTDTGPENDIISRICNQ